MIATKRNKKSLAGLSLAAFTLLAASDWSLAHAQPPSHGSYDDYDITVVEEAEPVSTVPDPLESMNRAVNGFNRALDVVLFNPLSFGYRAIVPSPVRQGVTNALDNLREPNNMLNALLQGDPYHAFSSLWRFILNSTFGVAGFFDFAGANTELTRQREDFGQTLAHWGAGHGAYLVLPVVGPSSVRDGFGFLVDIATNPFTWVLHSDAQWVRVGVTVLDAKERNMDFLTDTYKSSIDPYATIRSAYGQYRAKQVEDTGYHGEPFAPRCR